MFDFRQEARFIEDKDVFAYLKKSGRGKFPWFTLANEKDYTVLSRKMRSFNNAVRKHGVGCDKSMEILEAIATFIYERTPKINTIGLNEQEKIWDIALGLYASCVAQATMVLGVDVCSNHCRVYHID